MTRLKAPFPYYGGKSRAAAEIWTRLGSPAHYIEPFAGSLAVLLGRPWSPGVRHRETVNDSDGLLTNAWRAIQLAPAAVARHVDWPVSELDLTARHRELIDRRAELTERLIADPRWCDPEMAGWWIWGRCAWVGGGWGESRARRRPHVNGHMDGQGVHRLGVDVGVWMARLADRLRHVRILCGDWACAVKVKTLRGGHRNPEVAGVLLDPPYANAARSYSAGHYAHDDGAVAADARAWAIEHGDDPRNRIALCGLLTEHAQHMPASWDCWTWTGGQGASATQERVWLSPHCLRPQGELFEHLEVRP